LKVTIESYVQIIIIAFMVMLSTCYICTSLNTQYAHEYHARIVSDIEASDFSQEVIDEWVAKAQEDGFQLEVENRTENKKVRKVRLVYHYSIPLVSSLAGEREIVGVAR